MFELQTQPKSDSSNQTWLCPRETNERTYEFSCPDCTTFIYLIYNVYSMKQ